MTPMLGAAVGFALGCYVLAIVIVLARLLRGPLAQDRILALDFIYVNAMLIVLALGVRYGSRMTFEVALLIALFGFVSTAAFAKFLLRGEVIE
jgi:multicomponent K+:H+ antiporter subunit F